MNVDELYRLGAWYAAQFKDLDRRYRDVMEPLIYNASQSDKRPVEDQLNSLVMFLNNIQFDNLSIEQLKMLNKLGVDAYIGRLGAEYVNSAVRTSNYDPATAVQRLDEAIHSINDTYGKLAAYIEAVDGLGFGPDDVLAEDGYITIRVGFQNDVAINNVTDWKDTAKEWYDIIRGLSMACDEKPEDVKVIGAETGSVILILAGTAAFTALLARISKHITTSAKDIINVGIAMEDLRQKRMLTRAMEIEFKKIEKEKTENAVAEIENLLEGATKITGGDVSVALTASIKKLLTFSEKGGTVDFIAPEDEEEHGEEGESEATDDGGLKAALIAAKAAIREYQGERESLKLLTDGTKRS